MSEQKELDLEVITKMNEVYFGERGRPGTNNRENQPSQAADYFLKLLEGIYIDPSSKTEKRIKADAPQEIVLLQALNAFTDYTYSGCDFLYHQDPNISDEIMRNIALKIIEKVEGADFTLRECAQSALVTLTGMQQEEVLKSAKGTWLEDHWNPPRVPYDADITNRMLIPEAVQYARQNIPFLK